jgi:hypothetical protein
LRPARTLSIRPYLKSKLKAKKGLETWLQWQCEVLSSIPSIGGGEDIDSWQVINF